MLNQHLYLNRVIVSIVKRFYTDDIIVRILFKEIWRYHTSLHQSKKHGM